MALIFPSDIQVVPEDRYENDEIDTLVTLRDGLSDDYRVYHGVHWSRANPKYTVFGEIDFVIVNPAGHILVIEQKNGRIEETPQGLEKHYRSGRRKLIESQIQKNIGVFRDKFKGVFGKGRNLIIDYIIYCPDHRVVELNAAGVDMSRTVDAASARALPERVAKLLETDKPEKESLVDEIHRFLSSAFRIAPDVNAYKTSQRRIYRHLLEGLSEVIENLEFEPFRLRVVGTAGSGKTQVTMRFCEQAIAAGKKPLLLCFNRPLADKLVAHAPDGVLVDTYFGFIRQMVETAGGEIDFRQSKKERFWKGVQEQLLAATLAGLPKFDCLVVDEGQDFERDWYDILQMFLAEDATQLWLEDPLQNLRRMESVDLPGFVTYRETANFRTPTSIAEFIKATLESEFEQRNSLPGLGVSVYEYETPVEFQRILDSRINQLAKEGFAATDIAVISCRGMSSTALSEVTQLGKFKVRRFTGEYGVNSEQMYTDGDLAVDSIFRFKGQQAPAVILVDLDANLKRDDWGTGILYCAMTRATVRLELVTRNDCPWLDTFRANLGDGVE